ncbi:uroporphyrinogen-III synthase [Exophiala dermatitidis]|nr:uroporphyrinogen-III synthase [Exophiala dermatitidis]
MAAHPPSSSLTIPVLLLKTRSQPHDAYEEYFATTPASARNTTQQEEAIGATSPSSSYSFVPQFVPVLEHRPHVENLAVLKEALESETLSQRYGGMIFTSQRAVEAWTEVVKSVEREHISNHRVSQSYVGESIQLGSGIGVIEGDGIQQSSREQTEQTAAKDGNTAKCAQSSPSAGPSSFPIYSVGPATSRALNTLVSECGLASSPSSSNKPSPFARLAPVVLGEHGTGAQLGQYILSHYNARDEQSIYTTRPTRDGVAAVGERHNKQHSIEEKLEDIRSRTVHENQDQQQNQENQRKKGLLFLVGEQRRDIIPKTLMDPENKLHPRQRISVDEVEVYSTDVMSSFQRDFEAMIRSSKLDKSPIVVVVVFSPQGSESMLRALGFIDESNRLTAAATGRWENRDRPANSRHHVGGAAQGDSDAVDQDDQPQTYVIVTIGPTTRDHLKTKFGFDADVCAAKPSPEGVGEGVKAFLSSKGLI